MVESKATDEKKNLKNFNYLTPFLGFSPLFFNFIFLIIFNTYRRRRHRATVGT